MGYSRSRVKLQKFMVRVAIPRLLSFQGLLTFFHSASTDTCHQPILWSYNIVIYHTLSISLITFTYPNIQVCERETRSLFNWYHCTYKYGGILTSRKKGHVRVNMNGEKAKRVMMMMMNNGVCTI